MDEKQILEAVEQKMSEAKSHIDTKTAESKTEVDKLKSDYAALETKFNELKENGASVSELKQMQEHLDKMDIKLQKNGGRFSNDEKSFNQNLEEALEEHADQIKSFGRSGGGNMKLQMKAAGDMSYASNFANGSQVPMTTEYRQGVLMQPDKTKYLREIIPGGQTDGSSIWYPKHTGGEGSPAPWKDGSGAKPIFDFDFDSANVPVEWIAGIVRVPRQMLDDVKWLKSFLQANMLKALYKAENNQIMNGTGVSPQLHGLMPQAEEYDGNYTVFVEQLVDAAAQVGDNEHDANYVLLNNRDAVKIALNKATGSGEYDLPPGSVGYVNGQLTIAGLNVITLPSSQMAASSFLVGDFSATQLITRLTPEIKFFDQNKDDVEKNMVTIRIEERIALATYFPNAFVKNKTV